MSICYIKHRQINISLVCLFTYIELDLRKIIGEKSLPGIASGKSLRSVALDDTKRTSMIFKVNDMRRC